MEGLLESMPELLTPGARFTTDEKERPRGRADTVSEENVVPEVWVVVSMTWAVEMTSTTVPAALDMVTRTGVRVLMEAAADSLAAVS